MKFVGGRRRTRTSRVGRGSSGLTSIWRGTYRTLRSFVVPSFKRSTWITADTLAPRLCSMNRGAARMAFPTFDGAELVSLIKELLRIDDRWMPTDPGCSMYIRPTVIGTRASLGVGPSSEVLLFVMCVRFLALSLREEELMEF